MFRRMGSYIIIQMTALFGLPGLHRGQSLSNSGFSALSAQPGPPRFPLHPVSTRSQDEAYLFSGS
ncbi:protein of unknown function [Alcaligenes faecalis subsp. faecalis]|nr:protein of unknown function [Alcaligenes faecalis subsp. faecalis]